MAKQSLVNVYGMLLRTHGDPSDLWHQWCLRDKAEPLRQLVAIGAILVQRTSWKNADLALRNLKAQGLLSLNKLSEIRDPSFLVPYTKPAGFHQTKPRRLIEFSSFVIEGYKTLSAMRNEAISTLRPFLLDVYGIGPETADTILLYALDMPSFVIDAYTRAWLQAQGYRNHAASYDELKTWFESSVPCDVRLYQNFHILIIVDQKGKEGSWMEEV